jgi:hypothetical protein
MSTTAADGATTKAKKAQARREKCHAEKNGEPLAPKKRGNPGNFGGVRLRFLEAATDDYLTASSQGRGHIQPFLSTFMASWWRTFPWYIDLDPEDILGSLTKVNFGMMDTATKDPPAAGAATGDALSASVAGSAIKNASGAGAAGAESGDASDTGGAMAGSEEASGASNDAEVPAHGIAVDWQGSVENVVSGICLSVTSMEGKH